MSGGRKRGNLQSAKALLFATAQTLVLDQLRRRQVARIEPVAEMRELFVPEEGPTPADKTARNQELDLLTQAIQSLPDRCRQARRNGRGCSYRTHAGLESDQHAGVLRNVFVRSGACGCLPGVGGTFIISVRDVPADWQWVSKSAPGPHRVGAPRGLIFDTNGLAVSSSSQGAVF